MLGLIVFIAFVAIVVVTIRALKDDGQNTEPPKKTDTELLSDVNYLVLLREVLRQAKRCGDTDTVQAMNNLTYLGPLPDQLPDGSYTSIYDLQDYNIAGINYRDGIDAYLGDFEGYLQPEPDNEHDPNAIAVYNNDGHHLGYIPAACTGYIRSLGRTFPMPVTGTIEQEHDGTEDRDYFVGTVYFYSLKKV